MIHICEVIAVKEHPKYFEIVFEMVFFGLCVGFVRGCDEFTNQ